MSTTLSWFSKSQPHIPRFMTAAAALQFTGTIAQGMKKQKRKKKVACPYLLFPRTIIRIRRSNSPSPVGLAAFMSTLAQC